MKDYQYVLTVKADSQQQADEVVRQMTLRRTLVATIPVNKEGWVWVHAVGEDSGSECFTRGGEPGTVHIIGADSGICEEHDRRVSLVYR